MGSVLTLYASSSPANNIANLNVPRAGRLTGVGISILAPASGADFTCILEVSQSSVSTYASNDSRSAICVLAIGSDLTTSGVADTGKSWYMPMPGILFQPGDKIYLHTSGTAITFQVMVQLQFDFNL